jgi:hypothetical protein
LSEPTISTMLINAVAVDSTADRPAPPHFRKRFLDCQARKPDQENKIVMTNEVAG